MIRFDFPSPYWSTGPKSTAQVPEDILQDEPMFELYQQYKEQQAQFKAVHSHLENLRSSSMSSGPRRAARQK